MADLQALGLIEHYPRVTEMGTVACVIRVNAGKTFDETGGAFVNWGDSPANILDNHSASSVDLDGYIKGQSIALPIDSGLTEGEAFYYQLVFSDGGQQYQSDIIGPVVAGIIPTGAMVRIGVIAAAQHLHIINNDNLGLDNRTDVFLKTIENLAARRPHMVIGGGNNIWNAEEGSNMWPVDEDGMTVDGDHYHHAQSQLQCEISCRLLARDMGSLLSTVPLLEAEGPAMGVQHWFSSANNGAINDLQAWALAAMHAHYGNWANSDKFSGDADGRYGSFDVGPVKVCVCTSQPNTILRTTDPATVSTRPDDLNDHTWGQDEWDYFFDATTGVVTLADPEVTPWILFVSYSIISGFSNFTRTPLGGVLNAVDKAASRDSYEHGDSASWTNPYSYTGDYAALGIHKAIVARTKANGCRAIFAYGSARMYCYEELDGVVYVCCGRPCGSRNSPWEYRDFTTGGYGVIVPTPLNLNRNAVYRGASGHEMFYANSDVFVGEYIRSYIPGLMGELFGAPIPVTEPIDGIAVDGAVAHRFTLTRQPKARSMIRAGSGTFKTDSTTPEAAGTTQPTPLAGEPVSMVGEFGEGWEAFTDGAGDNAVYIRECASTIDSAIVLATRRPVTAAASAVRQTACKLMHGLDREIRLKIRAAGRVNLSYIGILTLPAIYHSTTTGKGLILQVGSVSGSTALRLRFDFGGTFNTIVDGSPLYEFPENAAFDAGIRIRVRGRRVLVWADDGTGALTLRINQDIGATFYGNILGSPTMRCVGIGSSTSNVSTGITGSICEWKDFHARYLEK